MEFARLLEIVGQEPVFETALLLAGNVDARQAGRQLCLCAKEGRLYQLRRGLYAFAPFFQEVKPHPCAVAPRIARFLGGQNKWFIAAGGPTPV